MSNNFTEWPNYPLLSVATDIKHLTMVSVIHTAGNTADVINIEKFCKTYEYNFFFV